VGIALVCLASVIALVRQTHPASALRVGQYSFVGLVDGVWRHGKTVLFGKSRYGRGNACFFEMRTVLVMGWGLPLAKIATRCCSALPLFSYSPIHSEHFCFWIIFYDANASSSK